MTARIPAYFVVMRDHGKLGREAVVDPEITRREVISRIRSREYKDIVFIHYVSADGVENVTDEIMDAAGVPDMVTGPPRLSPSERLEAMRDRVRDYRKQGVV